MMKRPQRKISPATITEYEHEHAGDIPSGDRPVFHLTPPVGWMNDPNGFSWYRGNYHLFYQYYPFDTRWGPVSWGHAVSGDLIRWEHLEPALVPDQPYDIDGCFSGTAIELEGRQMLMYTGFVLEDQKGRGRQRQCVAFGDGRSYHKYEGNPVITEKDLPGGGDPYEFRDPGIYRAEDGSFRALLGNRDPESGARILQYRSHDGLSWEFDRVMAAGRDDAGRDRLGWMWECPDFFPLGGRRILLLSAMDTEEGKVCFCLIGEMAGENFREISCQQLDLGLDFYAGQTLLSPDGRRILIGWMQNPDTAEKRGVSIPINGQMSLPRELSLEGGKIRQRPVRELEDLREDPLILKGLVLKEGREIRPEGLRGRCVDMRVSVRPRGEEIYRKFSLRFAGKGDACTEFSYEPAGSIAMIDRSRSGPGRTHLTRKRAEIRDRGGKLDLRLILDRFSAEVFINDGEQVMSAVIYTDRTAEDITLNVSGTAVVDIAKYRIKEK